MNQLTNVKRLLKILVSKFLKNGVIFYAHEAVEFIVSKFNEKLREKFTFLE